MNGFIFDLDGTLLDSLGLWLEIDKAYLKMHGIAYTRAYTDAIKKMTYDECAHYFQSVLGIKKDVKQIQQDWQDMSYAAYRDELPLKPYAFEFVQACAKHGKCILATSAHKESALAALKRTGLDKYMEDIVTTSEVHANKESPKIYEVCAQKIGCTIEQCYVFEDVSSAAKCAANAHFKVIGIFDDMWQNDYDELKKYCVQTIFSFKELLDKKEA